jgi:hypothetical protein
LADGSEVLSLEEALVATNTEAFLVVKEGVMLAER